MKTKFSITASTAKKKSKDSVLPVYLRFIAGRQSDIKLKTPIFVSPSDWDPKREELKINYIISEERRITNTRINSQLKSLRLYVENAFLQDSSDTSIDKNWLKTQIRNWSLSSSPENNTSKEHSKDSNKKTLFDCAELFLKTKAREFSQTRFKHYRSEFESLHRYELYVRATNPNRRKFILDFDTLTTEELPLLKNFLGNEKKLLENTPEILDKYPLKTNTITRSENYVIDILKRLRSFLLWCVNQGYSNDFPFRNYTVRNQVFGTPFYLTTEEVYKLYYHDFSDTPWLEKQRDIFVFHCNVGCRVGDLMKFKKNDVIDGTISYIASKTINDKGDIIRVPLNSIALDIVDKYKELPGENLLPFISPQKYNDEIKQCLKIAGINRIISILNPLTRLEEKHEIWEKASSHMARRTFIGNLYKQSEFFKHLY